MNNKKSLWEKVRKEVKGKVNPDVEKWIKDIDSLREKAKDVKVSFQDTLLKLRHGGR